MAGFGNVPTQLGKAIKPPGPKGPPPWHAGSATMLGRNIPPGGPASSFSGGVGLTPARPQTAPAPTPPKASGTTTAPPASPLDSTYYANLAANHLRVTNQINSLTTQGQNSATNLQDALAQLAYQQPRDQLGVEQAANRRGALYSSVEGQQQGDLLNKYQTKQSGLTRANSQRQATIGSQVSALRQGEPIYNGQQYDAAVIRATRAALANPATGQAPAVAAPAPARATLAPAPPGKRAAPKIPAGYKIGQGIPKAKPGQIGYRGGF